VNGIACGVNWEAVWSSVVTTSRFGFPDGRSAERGVACPLPSSATLVWTIAAANTPAITTHRIRRRFPTR
jgi:hypothetical protein